MIAQELEPLVACGTVASPRERGNVGQGLFKQRWIVEVITDPLRELAGGAAAPLRDFGLRPDRVRGLSFGAGGPLRPFRDRPGSGSRGSAHRKSRTNPPSAARVASVKTAKPHCGR